MKPAPNGLPCDPDHNYSPRYRPYIPDAASDHPEFRIRHLAWDGRNLRAHRHSRCVARG